MTIIDALATGKRRAVRFRKWVYILFIEDEYELTDYAEETDPVAYEISPDGFVYCD